MSGCIVWTLTVPWPRYPLMTPGGKASLAQNAGNLVEWLSLNRVARMRPPVYTQVKDAWALATKTAADSLPPIPVVKGEPLIVLAHLHRKQGRDHDALAIAEGIKPIIDALCAADCPKLPDDDQRYIRGCLAYPQLAEQGTEPRLVLQFWNPRGGGA